MNTQPSPTRSLRRRRTTGAASHDGTSGTPRSRSDEWWTVDAEILSALASGAKSPEEIADALGLSAHAVTSLVSMLAQQGKIRIRLIEAVA